MGIALAITSAATLGLSIVCARVGMRDRSLDDGLFMSALVNVLMLVVVLPFLTLPTWDLDAVLIFVLAGLATTVVGRGAALRSVRLVGPSRASVFFITAPFFTALLGWMILDEAVAPVQLAGGLLIVIGIRIVIRSQDVAEPLMNTEGTIRPDGSVDDNGWRANKRLSGYSIAMFGGFSLGLGHALRKLGLNYYPSAVMGAFVGALTSLIVIVGGNLLAGRLRQLFNDNFRPVPLMFVLAGFFSGIGLLATFAALTHLHAWIVSLMQGTQGLWTIVWSYLFIRREERLGWDVVVAAAVITFGAFVTSLG